ncbi:MBL fold metallo-hydrolase [soil metagenome]
MQSIDQLTIRRFIGGPMLTACYALIAPGQESILIDAPRDAWRGAVDAANGMDAPVRRFVATHGHWDHITDASDVQTLGIPMYGHPADTNLCADPMGQRGDIPFVIEPVELDHELAEGDRLILAGHEIQILHTPGHTPGSISLWLPESDVLFTGDTVLKGGAGYLERPECDAWALASSVLRIASLPEATTLYPGHGAPTTIHDEPWLSETGDREALVELWQSGEARWTPRA